MYRCTLIEGRNASSSSLLSLRISLLRCLGGSLSGMLNSGSVRLPSLGNIKGKETFIERFFLSSNTKLALNTGAWFWTRASGSLSCKLARRSICIFI